MRSIIKTALQPTLKELRAGFIRALAAETYAAGRMTNVANDLEQLILDIDRELARLHAE